MCIAPEGECYDRTAVRLCCFLSMHVGYDACEDKRSIPFVMATLKVLTGLVCKVSLAR